jgi:hypothetical protein
MRDKGRALTAAERNLAASMFGTAIDYDRVCIHAARWWPFQPRRVTMAPDGHIWFHPQGGLYCEDFASRDLGTQGLFVHELTHVWQHQRGIFLPLARHPFCRYDYALRPGWPLHRYGLEQQAEIVRHIFLLRQGAAVRGAPPLAQYETLLPVD